MNDTQPLQQCEELTMKSITDKIVKILRLHDGEDMNKILDDLLKNGRQSLTKYKDDIIPSIYTAQIVNKNSELLHLLKDYFQLQWKTVYGLSNEWFVSFLKQHENTHNYQDVLNRTAEYGNKYMKDCPCLSIVLQVLFDAINDQCLNETAVFNNLWVTLTNDGLKSIETFSEYIAKAKLDKLKKKEPPTLFYALRECYRQNLFKFLKESNIKDTDNLYEQTLDNVAEYGWLSGLKVVEDKIAPKYFKILLEKINSFRPAHAGNHCFKKSSFSK